MICLQQSKTAHDKKQRRDGMCLTLFCVVETYKDIKLRVSRINQIGNSHCLTLLSLDINNKAAQIVDSLRRKMIPEESTALSQLWFPLALSVHLSLN